MYFENILAEQVSVSWRLDRRKKKLNFSSQTFWYQKLEMAGRRRRKERVGKMNKAAWEKPVGCWEENWALIHWTRESSTKGEFCKPASKFLLQKPVYVKLAHPFFICYYCCRHLFVRNDLAILKDMLMHGSQTATVGTPECARIWNSTADADLV